MTIGFIPLPFGCRDVKLSPVTADPTGGSTTYGTAVDLPNSRQFTFAEAEDFEELRGDDGLVAVHGKGSSVDWQLESGGISLDAFKVLSGGTNTLTDTTPNQVYKYDKTTTDLRPYFKAEGQAISDSGGDFHVVIWKAKVTGELNGQLSDQAFWISGAKGKALGRASDGKIYTFVQNETAAAIT